MRVRITLVRTGIHLHLRLHPTFLAARPPHPLSFPDAEEGPAVYNVRSRGIGLR